MLRAAGLVAIGLSLAGAIAALGSDHWLTAGYRAEHKVSKTVNLPGSGRDEAAWLADRMPEVQATVASAMPALQSAARAFSVGTRVKIAGLERMSLDVISSQPVAPETGLLDAAGKPLIMVTARERGKGARLIRLLVEADRAPSETEKSL
jgi:hypothetical protein